MSDDTGIEWTDATWNPLIGCTRVSRGCDHCYAEGVVNRFAGTNDAWPARFDTVSIRPDRFLTQPLRWSKPRRVFVNSLSDLFHKDVPDDFIAQVFAVMGAAPQHTFQLLTKRHGRMQSLLNSEAFRAEVSQRIAGHVMDRKAVPKGHPGYAPWPLPNVWLGVSVEDQAAASLRIPALLRTPAAIRFLSCEPLLGPLYLGRYLTESGTPGRCFNIDGDWWHAPGSCPDCAPRVDWVIVGGESGPGSRPMPSTWVDQIIDQCEAAGVPLMFKQWGDWITSVPVAQYPNGVPGSKVWVNLEDGTTRTDTDNLRGSWVEAHRVGKKAAGRVVGNRTYDGYPA